MRKSDGGRQVHIIKPSKTRKFYVLRWWDTDKRAWRQKSTKSARYRDAVRMADELREQLLDGVTMDPHNWLEFAACYEREHLSGLAEKTRAMWKSTRNWIESVIQPVGVDDITERQLGALVSHMRDKTMSENSIAAYMRTLKAALSWGYRQRMLQRMPSVPMPIRVRKGKASKGRPLTEAEFQRLLKHCPNGQWKRLLTGLWLSGFRLSEALDFHWTDITKIHPVDIDARRPMMSIPGESEKAHQDRLLPFTPDFAAFLRKTPQDKRDGWVFQLEGK